jgi:hypothetical protein
MRHAAAGTAPQDDHPMESWGVSSSLSDLSDNSRLEGGGKRSHGRCASPGRDLRRGRPFVHRPNRGVVDLRPRQRCSPPAPATLPPGRDRWGWGGPVRPARGQLPAAVPAPSSRFTQSSTEPHTTRAGTRWVAAMAYRPGWGAAVPEAMPISPCQDLRQNVLLHMRISAYVV